MIAVSALCNRASAVRRKCTSDARSLRTNDRRRPRISTLRGVGTRGSSGRSVRTNEPLGYARRYAVSDDENGRAAASRWVALGHWPARVAGDGMTPLLESLLTARPAEFGSTPAARLEHAPVADLGRYRLGCVAGRGLRPCNGAHSASSAACLSCSSLARSALVCVRDAW